MSRLLSYLNILEEFCSTIKPIRIIRVQLPYYTLISKFIHHTTSFSYSNNSQKPSKITR